MDVARAQDARGQSGDYETLVRDYQDVQVFGSFIEGGDAGWIAFLFSESLASHFDDVPPSEH
eukprot:777394-Pyramimonas_sp.AAC.1